MMACDEDEGEAPTLQGVLARDAGVVIVCGPTASSKSALAVRLATVLGGEIVNADAVQMYGGCDIATNKATLAERAGVPHHLLGHADAFGADVTVVQWVHATVECIAQIHARGRVAIVCGGTNYYLHSLLWEGALLADALPPLSEPDAARLRAMSLPDKCALLERLDAAAFQRLNPADERKITRSLEVCLAGAVLGVTQSALHREQTRTLRYRNAVVLRLAPAPEPLQERIRARVDGMMRAGLFEEASAFFAEWTRRFGGDSVDINHGIWQSIGLKEFLPHWRDPAVCSLDACVDRIKVSTCQYAKMQLKWLDKKLCPPIDHFVLRGDVAAMLSDPLFSTEALAAACEWVPATAAATSSTAPVARLECCGKVLIGAATIDAHLQSRPHKRRNKAKKKRAEEAPL